MTLSIFNPWLSKLITVRSDNKLSPAALETLAIVAYKQPIIRADVEAIRGVASGEVLRNLMYKGLAKIVGRAEILGRPMLYGTTKEIPRRLRPQQPERPAENRRTQSTPIGTRTSRPHGNAGVPPAREAMNEKSKDQHDKTEDNPATLQKRLVISKLFETIF